MERTKTPSQEAPKPKRRYERPEILHICLSGEEILAVGCKMEGGGSSFGGTACNLSACSTVTAS